jgi:hypothetical protein
VTGKRLFAAILAVVQSRLERRHFALIYRAICPFSVQESCDFGQLPFNRRDFLQKAVISA